MPVSVSNIPSPADLRSETLGRSFSITVLDNITHSEELRGKFYQWGLNAYTVQLPDCIPYVQNVRPNIWGLNVTSIGMNVPALIQH